MLGITGRDRRADPAVAADRVPLAGRRRHPAAVGGLGARGGPADRRGARRRRPGRDFAVLRGAAGRDDAGRRHRLRDLPDRALPRGPAPRRPLCGRTGRRLPRCRTRHRGVGAHHRGCAGHAELRGCRNVPQHRNPLRSRRPGGDAGLADSDSGADRHRRPSRVAGPSNLGQRPPLAAHRGERRALARTDPDCEHGGHRGRSASADRYADRLERTGGHAREHRIQRGLCGRRPALRSQPSARRRW